MAKVASKRSSTKKGKSNDSMTTYLVVGVLVVLILFLLYTMHRTPTTSEGFTAPSSLYDPEKEVLIAFCKMQGCGHCVRFQDNVWSKVEPELNGKKNKDGKTIKMITVDPKHELSSDVSGFPTIKKYGDEAGEYVEFEDKRTIENFTAFCMN
jgi:hypothetical protein